MRSKPIKFVRDGLERVHLYAGHDLAKMPATAGDLIAALQANPQLRASVLEQIEPVPRVKMHLSHQPAEIARAYETTRHRAWVPWHGLSADEQESYTLFVRELERIGDGGTAEKLRTAESELAAERARVVELEVAGDQLAGVAEAFCKEVVALALHNVKCAWDTVRRRSSQQPDQKRAATTEEQDDFCHCSDYQSSGLPCLPGKCPNNPSNAMQVAAMLGRHVAERAATTEEQAAPAAEQRCKQCNDVLGDRSVTGCMSCHWSRKGEEQAAPAGTDAKPGQE